MVPIPHTELAEELGSRIVTLRKARGWTQRELARRAALPYHKLSRIERGRRLPTVPELLDLRRALAVDLETLVFGREGRAAAGPAAGVLLRPEDLRLLDDLVQRLKPTRGSGGGATCP